MPVTVTGYLHARITVTDLHRSRSFYEFRDPDNVALELIAPTS